MNQISALIITFNEEANIFRTLSSITWISHVLIIDSGSSDNTLAIVSQFRNTQVIYRKFDTFANQCNFGLSLLTTDWVLSLDADYVLSSELSLEINERLLDMSSNNCLLYGYSISFQYCINGKPIRSGLLPPRTCVYKRKYAQYLDEGHGHKIVINGKIGELRGRIYHDDRKPLSRWLINQLKYQKEEAIMLQSKKISELPIQDILRKHTFLAPFAAFFMCLILKGGILDGRSGIIYAMQRLVAETLLYLYIYLGKD